MLLSVVIPVYNVDQYLDRCIESVVEQTFRNLEIILVDDGSTDNSGYKCDLWAKKDDRIIVIHKQNGGLSSARNAGIEAARGDYLAFVDSDDFIEKDMYKCLITATLNYGKDIACCGRFIDIWGEKTKEAFVLDEVRVFSTKESIREVLLLKTVDVAAWDKIYKKSLFQKIRYPVGKISEDAAVIFQIIHASNGIVHTGKPFYHYIYRKGSISKSSYDHKKYDVYMNCTRTEKFIAKNYQYLNRECRIYCCNMVIGLLESMYENRKNFKSYNQDYKKYRYMFEQYFWQLLFSKDIPWKLKIKALLIYTHTFQLFLLLKAKKIF